MQKDSAQMAETAMEELSDEDLLRMTSSMESTLNVDELDSSDNEIINANLEAEASLATQDELGSMRSYEATPFNHDAPSETAQSNQCKQSTLKREWLATLPTVDQQWLAHALFLKNGRLRSDVVPWSYPPQPAPLYTALPSPSDFFGHRFFLWLPSHMWGLRYTCSQQGCDGHMTKAGLYATIRRVIDLHENYYMGTECLQCSRCHKKLAAWTLSILNQTPLGYRSLFPAVLSYRLALDKKVISLLRDRGLGNGCASMRRKLLEAHSEHYLEQRLRYYEAVGRSVHAAPDQVSIDPPPTFQGMPTNMWFQRVWIIDVFGRVDLLKAKITSVFGSILKLDSTKRVAKKLSGSAEGTAAWVTNVGNELGQILISVVTAAEGEGLLRMAHGLESRYSAANIPPLAVIYVDRDCCEAYKKSIAKLFPSWTQTAIRLDVCHFMRRLAACVTTESHPLFGPFMASLSASIYVWDAEDLSHLRRAIAGVPGRFSSQPTRQQLAKHCRRTIRGAEEIRCLIDKLLGVFLGDGGTDSTGVPLLDTKKMRHTWTSLQEHLSCLQDPVGVQLYKQTATMMKGGVQLPVYRCHRGTSSLKNFHLHLNRFLPAAFYADIHFQAYLLEGLVRWNQDRKEAYGGTTTQLKTYNNELCEAVVHEARAIRQDPGLHLEETPSYTGELIGVEYLLSQSNEPIDYWNKWLEGSEAEEALDCQEEDEEEVYVEDQTIVPPDLEQDPSSLQATLEINSYVQPVPIPEHNNETNKKSGYDCVVALASYMVKIRNVKALSNTQVAHVIDLYKALPQDNKIHKQKRHCHKGGFAHSKSAVIPGVESVQRGIDNTVAQRPDANRLVEAVLLELVDLNFSRGHKQGNQWAAVMHDYRQLQDVITSNSSIMAETNMSLFDVNLHTLYDWSHRRRRQGVDLPNPQMAVLCLHPVNSWTSEPVTPPQTEQALEPTPTPISTVFKHSQMSVQVPTCPPVPVTDPQWHNVAARTKLRVRVKEGDRIYKRRKIFNTCRSCGQPKLKETGHKGYRGYSYCPHSNITYDTFLENVLTKRAEKKK